MLRELGPHPETGRPLQILKGRYGPYVTDGKLNATIGKDQDPEEVTMEEAVTLLAEAALRPKKPGRGGRRKAVKKTAKKKVDEEEDRQEDGDQEDAGQEGR